MRTQFNRLWTDNRKYFLTACLLFGGGAVLGFLQAHALEEMVKSLLGQLKDVIDRIHANGGGVFATFWAIFSNNVTSSLMMMAMGLFFAFFPVFGLMANGVLLGFIFAKYSSFGVSPWLVFAAGILPHGILELPAVLFAAGVGIRLGMLSLRSVGALIQPVKWEQVKNDWYDTLKQFPMVVLTVIGMLFLAAIIESSVTPLILQEVLGDQLKQLNLIK
ncbi:stage II sporulation protein M [Brevibacillus borstelensis]|uniref:stage II sporulation protein M n=1 Tax=Brevibacillus borstelensis TaxID=45462 RepID=UPI0030BDA81B